MIAPMIPKRRCRRGSPRNDERKTLNGILYVLKAGCAWQDLPSGYSSDTTHWRRLQAWSADGTWERTWRILLSQLDAQGKLTWGQVFLDGSFVPAKKGDRGWASPKWAKAAK